MAVTDKPSAVQILLFSALALLACIPLVSFACRSMGLRARVREWGCWRWVPCCVSYPNDSENLEAGRGENGVNPTTIAAYYQMLYAHHLSIGRPCLALGLTTWREDVRHRPSVRDVFNMKLEQIQVPDESMQRYEPPVVPLSNTDVELSHPQMPEQRDTALCDDEEEKDTEA